MDSFSSVFQKRISQVEKSLFDLNREISTGVTHLYLLKEHATKIVKSLCYENLSESSSLKQFVQVNSFLLRYLSVLTEINCNFEILQTSESLFKIDIPEIIPENFGKFVNFFCNGSEQIQPENKSENMDKVIVKKNINSETESGFQTDCVSELLVSNTITSYLKEIQQQKKEEKVLDLIKEVNLENVSNCNSKSSTKSEKKSHRLKSSKSKNNYIGIINSNLKTSLLSSSSSGDDESNSQKLISCGKTEASFDKSTSGPAQLSKSKSCPTTDRCDKSIETDDHFSSYTESNLLKTNSNERISVQENGNENVKILGKTSDNLVENRNEIVAVEENSTEENEIKIIPIDISPKVGDEFEVRVEHIKSPSEFYVHIINHNLNSLAEVEKILKSVPADPNNCNLNSKYDKASLMKKIGSYALHYSKCDEAWFRVKITNWYLNCNDNFVSIQLLDYGESKCVNFDSLQPMPEFLKQFPAFAHRCHLHGIHPVCAEDKKKESLTWGKETTEKMKDIVENSNKLKIVITSRDSYHCPDSLPVTLWLDDKENKCVNKLLVKSNYATEAVNDNCNLETKTLPESTELIENWNPMGEDYKSYYNMYDLDITDPASMIYGYVGKDYDRICWQFSQSGKCVKGKSCRKEHEQFNPSGYTTDKEEIYVKAFNVLADLSINETFYVQITCVLDVNHFFCILNKFDPGDNEEDLSTFQVFMNKNENVQKMRKLLIPPSVGQVVIAQFSEDDAWYRAKVLESQPERDLYTVVFVDYGNRETLPLSKIRAIEGQYLHMPFQAIQCFIYGVDKKPEISMETAINYLNEKFGKGNIFIEVVAKLPGEGANVLVNVFNENDENIGENLIADGYAIKKKEIIPSDEIMLPG